MPDNPLPPPAPSDDAETPSAPANSLVARNDRFDVSNTTPTEILLSDLLENDVDPEGDAFFIQSIDSVSAVQAVITMTEDTLIYWPMNRSAGLDFFRYTIVDENGATSTAFVDVLRTNLNRTPIARNDTYAIEKGGTLTVEGPGVLANDSDPDDDFLAVGSKTEPSHGTLTIDALTGAFTYVPRAGFTGIDSFTYVATDFSRSNDATVTITVVERAIVAGDDAAATPVDRPLTIDATSLLANDASLPGRTLSLSVADVSALRGTLEQRGPGVLVFAPERGFIGETQFTYEVSDGANADTAVVTIAVTNRAPVAGADGYTVEEGRALAIPAPGVLGNDSDADGHAITVTGHGAAQNGTLTITAAGGIDYQPQAGFTGTETITYTLSDGYASADGVLTITVVEGTPVAADDAFVTLTGRSIPITQAMLLANDSDPQGTALRVTSIDAVGIQGSLGRNSVTGDLFFTPMSGFSGVTGFRYTATDGVNTDTAFVTLTVRATNARPAPREDVVATEEGRTLTLSAAMLLGNDRDGDGDALTIVRLTQPERGTAAFDAVGNVVYTPRAGFDGVETFTYVVSDGLAEAEAKVTITVAEGTPIARADLLSGFIGTPLTIAKSTLLANDTDPQGTPLVITVLDPAGLRGTIQNTPDSILFTPEPGFKGDTAFRYTVSDGVNTATAIATIRVSNEEPVAQDDTVVIDQGWSTFIFVLSNDSDADGQPLSIASFSPPVHGTARPGNGAIFYTAPTDFSGIDSFSYTVTDGIATDLGQVRVEVRQILPVLEPDFYTTPSAVPVTIRIADILANDRDPFGRPLQFDSMVPTGDFPAEILPHGTEFAFVVTPARGFKGDLTLTYQVSSRLFFPEGIITIRVTNEAPAARDDAFSVAEGRTLAAAVLANDTDPDGNRLEVASIRQPINGTASIATDGTILYTPNAGFTGTDVLSYFVSDGLEVDEANVVITVLEGSPVARTDSITIGVDRIITIEGTALLANDSDPQGDALAVTGFDTSRLRGTVTDVTATGFIFAPEPGFRGETSFRYTVSDGANASTGTVLLNISPNVPRVANDDAYTTGEGRTLSLTAPGILANDAPPPGTALALIDISAAANGSVQTDPFGQFIYVPNAGFTGTEVLTYRVTDGSSFWQAQVTINVVDGPPVANDDTLTAAVNVPLTITEAMLLGNDSDPGSDPLEITDFELGGLRGSLSKRGNDFVFTPDRGFVGETSFRYKVSDGTATDSATVTIRVVNAPPIARDDAFTTEEGRPLTANVLANDTEPDGQPLTVISHTGAANGTLAIAADGTLTYTPRAGFDGLETVAYRVSDGLLERDAKVVITVAEGSPVLVADSFTTIAGSPLRMPFSTLLVNDSDPQGTPLAFMSAEPAGMRGALEFTTEGGVMALAFTPEAGFAGETSFRYVATDGVNVATTTVTIRVTNEAPIARDDAFSVEEGRPLIADVLGNDSDADGQPLVTTGTVTAANGTASISAGGTLTYMPSPGFVGTETLTYTVTDGVVTDTATVTITVFEGTPLLGADRFSTPAGIPLTMPFSTLLANDSDPQGTPLAILGVQQPGLRGTVEYTTAGGVMALVFTPEAGFSGETSFRYTASDGANAGTGTVTIRVGNEPPVAREDEFATEEGRALTFTAAELLANDSDGDGDSLSVIRFTEPRFGTITADGAGGFTYTPRAGFDGVDSFIYVATDGQAEAEAKISITVAEGTPIARADLVTGPASMPLVISKASLLANDTDPQGTPLVITVLDPAGLRGTIQNTGDSVIFAPEANFKGDTAFRYTVSDGANTSSAVVTIRLTNEAPVARDDAATVEESRPITVDVLANDIDVDGQALSIVRVSRPAHGSVTVSDDGTLTYTPNPGFVGTDSLTYDISDGLERDQGRLVITVAEGSPIAAGESFTVPANATFFLTPPSLLANDSDPQGTPLSIGTLDTAGLRGTLSRDGDVLVYVAPSDFAGETSFRYAATDGVNSSFATVTLTIVNTPPTARDDAYTVEEGRSLAIPAPGLLANDSDAEGQALRISDGTGVRNGTLALTNDGSFVYRPTHGFVGTDSFTYTVTDGIATSTTTVTITVVEGAPIARDDAFGARHGVALSITEAMLLDNDSDPQASPLTITGFDASGLAGTLTRGAGGFSFIPNAGFAGETSFRYTVSDGANTAQGIARITVAPPPPPDTFGFSSGSRNQGEAPDGAAGNGGGLVAVAADPQTGTLIEAVGLWNSVKNAVTGVDSWSPALGADITVANFVDVRLDLGNAGATGLDFTVLGAKRGALETAGGDDDVRWFFHSNEGTWSNLAVIETAGGDDTILASTVSRTGEDDALLADNDAPGNGPLWNSAYDGRFSIARIDAGAGNDTIIAEARVRLDATGGAGNDSITGGLGNDVIIGGDGDDLLAGGRGADRFRFDTDDGRDVIADFSAAQGDRVQLSQGGSVTLAGASFTYGTTTVTAANGHVWTDADFLFV